MNFIRKSQKCEAFSETVLHIAPVVIVFIALVSVGLSIWNHITGVDVVDDSALSNVIDLCTLAVTICIYDADRRDRKAKKEIQGCPCCSCKHKDD